MTHICQICGHDKLNLVSGVLEDHLDMTNSNSFVCPASGTDRYAREEGKETEFSTAEEQAGGLLLNAMRDAKRKEIDNLRTALYREQARSRALREALERIAPMRGSSDKIQCLFVIQEVAQIASEALIAAPLPAAGDGELLNAVIERGWTVAKTDASVDKQEFYEVYDPIAVVPLSQAKTGRDAIRAAIRAEEEK